MRLDNRFKVIPFCCFGAENCTNYLGQKGYFANDIEDFHCIDLCSHGTLNKIHCDQAESFRMKEYKKDYKFFIPEYFVIQKEKEFRPFTIDEFKRKFVVGEPIFLRKRREPESEQYLILNGYRQGLYNDQMVTWIYFGPFAWTCQELFEEYEWKTNYLEDFKPFSVEE